MKVDPADHGDVELSQSGGSVLVSPSAERLSQAIMNVDFTGLSEVLMSASPMSSRPSTAKSKSSSRNWTEIKRDSSSEAPKVSNRSVWMNQVGDSGPEDEIGMPPSPDRDSMHVSNAMSTPPTAEFQSAANKVNQLQQPESSQFARSNCSSLPTVSVHSNNSDVEDEYASDEFEVHIPQNKENNHAIAVPVEDDDAIVDEEHDFEPPQVNIDYAFTDPAKADVLYDEKGNPRKSKAAMNQEHVQVAQPSENSTKSKFKSMQVDVNSDEEANYFSLHPYRGNGKTLHFHKKGQSSAAESHRTSPEPGREILNEQIPSDVEVSKSDALVSILQMAQNTSLEKSSANTPGRGNDSVPSFARPIGTYGKQIRPLRLSDEEFISAGQDVIRCIVQFEWLQVQNITLSLWEIIRVVFCSDLLGMQRHLGREIASTDAFLQECTDVLGGFLMSNCDDCLDEVPRTMNFTSQVFEALLKAIPGKPKVLDTAKQGNVDTQALVSLIEKLPAEDQAMYYSIMLYWFLNNAALDVDNDLHMSRSNRRSASRATPTSAASSRPSSSRAGSRTPRPPSSASANLSRSGYQKSPKYFGEAMAASQSFKGLAHAMRNMAKTDDMGSLPSANVSPGLKPQLSRSNSVAGIHKMIGAINSAKQRLPSHESEKINRSWKGVVGDNADGRPILSGQRYVSSPTKLHENDLHKAFEEVREYAMLQKQKSHSHTLSSPSDKAPAESELKGGDGRTSSSNNASDACDGQQQPVSVSHATAMLDHFVGVLGTQWSVTDNDTLNMYTRQRRIKRSMHCEQYIDAFYSWVVFESENKKNPKARRPQTARGRLEATAMTKEQILARKRRAELSNTSELSGLARLLALTVSQAEQRTPGNKPVFRPYTARRARPVWQKLQDKLDPQEPVLALNEDGEIDTAVSKSKFGRLYKTAMRGLQTVPASGTAPKDYARRNKLFRQGLAGPACKVNPDILSSAVSHSLGPSMVYDSTGTFRMMSKKANMNSLAYKKAKGSDSSERNTLFSVLKTTQTVQGRRAMDGFLRDSAYELPQGFIDSEAATNWPLTETEAT